MKVLAHILAFISAVPPDTRIAIYRTGEQVRVIHDFTDDVEALRKRLMKDGLAAPRDDQKGVAVAHRVSSTIRHELGSFALKEEQTRDLTAVTVRFPKQWAIDAKTSLVRSTHSSPEATRRCSMP